MDEQETVASEVVETPEVAPEVVDVPETPSVTDDVAPEEVPVVHEDDGSVGRELDHVVNQ